jgi:RNA polymerase sigma-70 factor (ECF subfamily)
VPRAAPDFERIFAKHSAFVWRVLARHGVRERDLPDVCQEVFVVVFKNLPQFEGRSSMNTWIYGICRRVAANYRGRAAHRRETLAGAASDREHDPSPAADAVAALAEKQSLVLLEQLLAGLPDDQREVFVLYEIEELNMREISEALECSQNTAFSRLYAARRELAAALVRWRAKRRVA